MKNQYLIVITVLTIMIKVIYVTIAVLALMGCRSDIKTEFVRSVSCYSDYSTVDWKELNNKYYTPNTANWPSGVDSIIIDGFPMEIACEYWMILQNACNDFHQKSLPLKSESTQVIIESLNYVESMFDTVFVKCVSQEYYMRLFPEMYNETMKPAIDELIEKLNTNSNN